jgi:hypothetical protein
MIWEENPPGKKHIGWARRGDPGAPKFAFLHMLYAPVKTPQFQT